MRTTRLARIAAVGAAAAIAGLGLVGCSGAAGSACPSGLAEALRAAVDAGSTVTVDEVAASAITPVSLAPLSICTLAVAGTNATVTAKGTIFFTAGSSADALDAALVADGFEERDPGSGLYRRSDTENAIVVPVGSPEKTGAPDVRKFFPANAIMVIVSSTAT